jgi:hypothetical protein
VVLEHVFLLLFGGFPVDVVGRVFERVFQRVSALGRGFVRLVQHARVLE